MPYEVLEDQEPALAGYEILPESESDAGFEILGPATEGLPTQPPQAPLERALSRPMPDNTAETAIPGVFSDMASGEGPGAFEIAMQPIVELPAVPSKFMQGILSPLFPGQMGAQIGEGAGKFVSKAASSLLSPGMIALAGIGAVAPPVAGAVIAGMGAAGLGPAAVEALEASKRGDVAGFTELSLDAGMAGLMASGGARGVVGRRGVEGGKEGRGVMALLPNRVDQSLQPLASKTVEMMLAEKPPILLEEAPPLPTPAPKPPPIDAPKVESVTPLTPKEPAAIGSPEADVALAGETDQSIILRTANPAARANAFEQRDAAAQRILTRQPAPPPEPTKGPTDETAPAQEGVTPETPTIPTPVAPGNPQPGLPSTQSSGASRPTEEPGLLLEGETGVDLPAGQVRLSKLVLSQDVPQFKAGANEKGVVRPLGGKFDPTGVGPIQVWRRLDGNLEVITGRHRFDLAQRSGRKSILSQIHNEADGFTATDAARLDAVLNIRDGQGTIADYARFFKNTEPQYTEAAAKSEGLLADAKGKAGFIIGTQGSPDLFAIHQAEKLGDAQAAAIATVAPNDPGLQALGIRMALDGRSAEGVADVMRLAKQRSDVSKAAADQGNLFDFDDSAIREMEAQSSLAAKERKDIRAQVNAVKGAAKKPEIAKEFGIDVTDPAGVQKKVAELEARLILLKEHPELAGQLPTAQAPAEPIAVVPKLRTGEAGTGEMFQGKDTPFNLAGETIADPARLAAEKAKKESDAAEAKRIADEQQQGFIGMGGAVPSEFARDAGTPTAMKYKLIDAERQKRGLEPLTKPEGLSDQAAMDKAMAKMDANPEAATELIAELEKNPRPIEDWENHLLLLRKIDLRNEYGRATRELAQAFEDGRLDDVAALRPRVQIWSDHLSQLEQVSRTSGSARGRALRALRVMANEDFSLAQMEMEKRADVGGRPLTDMERVELVARQKELESTNRAFQERVAELESLQRQAELDKSLAEAKAPAAKTYPPSVLDAAERIVSGWEKRAEIASKQLREDLDSLQALGIKPKPADPVVVARIIGKMAEIGVAKLGRSVLNLAKFSEAMIAEYGPKVEPFLKDAFDAAQKLLTLESDKIKGPISEQVKRKIKNVDVAEKITGAKEKIGAKLEQGDDANVTPSVRQLVRALVEQDPKITRDQLVDTVHDVLKEFVPEMTRIEAMDAISGRGKFWLPPQDVVSKTVRDLSTQIRLVAHQQDVLAKKPLPRTGYQPEPMSDIARQEQQKLNDLKRRHGVVVTDPASQLASTLAARKTYYTHRLADLRQEIASGERIVKSKSPSPTDPALESLKAEYETTKAENDSIFGKREMTDAQRVEIAMNAVEKSITDLEARIKAGDIGPRSRASKTPNTPELEAARARRDALQEELQELRDLAEPKKTPEEIALQSLRARLARENANLRDRMVRGDFSPKAKAPPIDVSKDAQAMSLAAEHEKLKRDYQQSRAKDQAARMNLRQKTWANVKETINLHRNYITAFDLPPVFRQGGFISLGNPARAARNFVRALSAISNEKTALRIEQEILHSPNATLHARFKLELPSFHEGRLTAQEEMVMSRLAQKIPGLRASNRGFITFLNLMRADTFDAMIKNMAKDPKNPTAIEGNATANYINVTTGRGPLAPKIKASSELLSTAFFAPRLLISRFQLLAGQPLYKGNARTRALIALEYGKALTGGAAVFGLAMLAGAEVETDPRSSDFLKLKFGDTRLDPLMGLQQVTVLLAREIFTRETKSLRTGKVSPIFGDKVPYGGETGGKIFTRFLRTKIAPSLGTAIDVWSGENVVGQDVTPSTVAANALIPISYQDIYKVMKEQGVPEGTALQMLNFLGMGLQHFNEKERRK